MLKILKGDFTRHKTLNHIVIKVLQYGIFYIHI